MIPKSKAYRVIRVSTGRVLFEGNKKDARRECRMSNEAMGIPDSHRWELTPISEIGNKFVKI
jgi:hypothetical protein